MLSDGSFPIEIADGDWLLSSFRSLPFLPDPSGYLLHRFRDRDVRRINHINRRGRTRRNPLEPSIETDILVEIG
jgi:hypothetical protein